MEVTYQGHHVRIATGGKEHEPGAPGVVLIHGSGMDRTTWQMQSRWLAHHGYNVAAIDLPGHGLSGGEMLETIEEMGQWTAGLVHELDLAPAHLVGFSMGTFVALEAAALDPGCARSLVLIGTGAAMPVHPALLSASYDDVPLAGGLMTSWGLSSSGHRGGHRSPGAWMIGASRALIESSPERVLGQDMTACSNYANAVSAASAVSVPITFVLGTEDKMTPIRTAAELIEAASDPSIIQLEASGHFMTIEKPIEVRDAIAVGIGWDGSR